MLKIRFSVLLAVVIILGSSSFSFSSPDIYSNPKYQKDYPEFIHIVINPDQTATFKYCETTDLSQCRTLGNREKYKLRDLNDANKKLNREGYRMMGADVVFLVGSALAGTIITLASTNPVTPLCVAIYAASGATGGSIYLIKGYLTPGSLNFFKKLGDARVINNDFISGKRTLAPGKITEFRDRLDEVLRGIS